MHKKLMLACMAIAAFAAFVIAPAAQGAVLTENTIPLAVGSSVTAKNTGLTRFTGSFNVSCDVAHLQGTVVKNSEGTILITVPIGSTIITNLGGVPCSSALGATTFKVTSEICIHIGKGTDIATITGCVVEGVTKPVTFDLTAAGVTCRYEAASVLGTVATNVTPASVVVTSQKAFEEAPGVFFCPDTGELDMTFDLYTTGGTTGLTVS